MARLLSLKRRNEIKAKLKKIGKAITDFFKKVENQIAPEILNASLHFMQGLKVFLDNGLLDKFTEATKTDLDDKLLEKARATNDKIIDYLLEGTECMLKETREEKLDCLIAIFKDLSNEKKKDAFANAHAKYLAEMDDNSKPSALYRIEANKLYLGNQIA